MQNRRDFLKNMALGGLVLPTALRTKAVAASDKLRVAHFGLNNMGMAHLRWFAAIPEVEIVGLADVDTMPLANAKSVLDGLYPNNKAQTVRDFRELLDRKDIDAVTYATPDHWHAQMAILAFQAGKHVYGEKPLSYSMREGRMMLDAQTKAGKIFQLGTQIHAGDNYHRVAELIQGGAIGKVKNVKIWKTGGSPVFNKINYQTPPSHFDYDFWQGPAPEQQYSPEKTHGSYRYFQEYSGGVYQDFWCHIADIVWWSVAPKKLKTIEATGGLGEGLSTTPGWINAKFQFENLNLEWSTEPPKVAGAEKKGIGAYFEGEKGTLICDYGTREITINGVVMTDIDSIQKTIIRSPGHQQNFVDAIKNNAMPQSNLAYALEMTTPMHLGLIAYKVGRKLHWNSKKEKFKNDDEANALLFREYRKGWNWLC